MGRSAACLSRIRPIFMGNHLLASRVVSEMVDGQIFPSAWPGDQTEEIGIVGVNRIPHFLPCPNIIIRTGSELLVGLIAETVVQIPSLRQGEFHKEVANKLRDELN